MGHLRIGPEPALIQLIVSAPHREKVSDSLGYSFRGEHSSKFAAGIGYIRNFSAPKAQDDSLPRGLAQIGSRERYQPKILVGGPLCNFAIINPFQSHRK